MEIVHSIQSPVASEWLYRFICNVTTFDSCLPFWEHVGEIIFSRFRPNRHKSAQLCSANCIWLQMFKLIWLGRNLMTFISCVW